MAHAIPDHLHVVFFGDGAIILDTRADRYRRLGPGLSLALAGYVEYESGRRAPSTVADPPAETDQRALAALQAHDLIIERPPGQSRAALKHPSVLRRSALDEVGRHHVERKHSPITVFWALFNARARLQVSGLDRTLGVVRTRERAGARDDPAGAIAWAQSFARIRLWFPERPRCLPDSIALHAILSREGLRSRLVIGVRDRPFAAHCWVEAGDTVLNDTLEHVSELTPILRI